MNIQRDAEKYTAEFSLVHHSGKALGEQQTAHN